MCKESQRITVADGLDAQVFVHEEGGHETTEMVLIDTEGQKVRVPLRLAPVSCDRMRDCPAKAAA